jgi:LmbE family N-acetylglucosaminyl deacetylase
VFVLNWRKRGETNSFMKHLFLSPHPDDAVLSCGGLIYQLAQAGESVTVITLMTGSVPRDVTISPFIEEHFRRWQLWPDPVPGRKAEDRQALQRLGANLLWGDFPDALYRTDGQGTALYPDLKGLFGEIDPRDPILAHMAKITDSLDPAAIIYAPMGAGHHVDHQLARDAALRWRNNHPGVALFFYEEYPYSAQDANAVQSARETLGIPAVPIMKVLSETAIAAKIEAVACYPSQISSFWDNLPAMAESVRQYARRVGQGSYAERLWQLVDEEKS